MPSPKTKSRLGFIVWCLKSEFYQERLRGASEEKDECIAEDTLVNTDRAQHAGSCGFQAVWVQPISASPSQSE